MVRSERLLLSGVTALACTVGTAVADAAPPTEGVRIDQLQPASPGSPFLRAEGPHETLERGVEYAVGVTADYAQGLVHASEVDTAGNETELPDPVEKALLLHVGGSILPAHWFQIDVSVPVGVMVDGALGPDQTVRVARDEIRGASAPGVGDLRVGLHFRPLDRKPFGILFGGRFWASFGSEDAYLSDKQFRGEVDLGFAGDVSRVLYGCTFSASPGLFLERNGDRGAAACALHVRVADFLSFGVEPTVATFIRLDRNDEVSRAWLIEPLGAARLTFGGFEVGLGAGPGFGGAPGTPELRGVLSLGYSGGGRPEGATPAGADGKPLDRDLDHIEDDKDACPTEAGPDSNDAALRGCPALDRDADGVRDDEDWCPQRGGVKHADPKANGCPDSDNDDLPDPIDTCPTEPGKVPTGCPQRARLTRDGFRVDPPIVFVDGELTPESVEAFAEVAATIRANPKLEMLSVGIGTKGSKPELADKRARAIMLVLRSQSLDTNRYEVVLKEELPAGVVLVRVVR